MLKIDDKALEYVKNQNLCFLVNGQVDKIKCDCCRTETDFKKIEVKVLYESEIKSYYEDYEDSYNIFEFQNVKVFISKDLKVDGDVFIYEKAKLPFKKRTFGIKGVSF